MRLNIFKLYKNIEWYWAIYQRYEKVILPRNRLIFLFSFFNEFAFTAQIYHD